MLSESSGKISPSENAKTQTAAQAATRLRQLTVSLRCCTRISAFPPSGRAHCRKTSACARAAIARLRCTCKAPRTPLRWRRLQIGGDLKMALPIGDRWFEHRSIGDGITLLWEPHVIPLMRCNIWHIRGRDRDLIIDTGMGVASLHDATRHLIDKPVLAVATHTHLDHVGGHHEFEETVVHATEAGTLS